MSIYDLQRSKRLREFGHGLGREGLAKLVLEVAKQICESQSYIEVICGAGRIAAIAQACNYDGYWAEKVELGKQNAEWLLNQALKRMQKIAAQDNAEGDLQQTHNKQSTPCSCWEESTKTYTDVAIICDTCGAFKK